MYINEKNIKYVSSSQVIHIFYNLLKSAKHVFFFISKGIFNQISIALYFIMLAPEFECAFGKGNCRILICLVLHR